MEHEHGRAAKLVADFSRPAPADCLESPWFEALAQAYAERMRRLAAAGDLDAARNARDWAIYWLGVHASRGAAVHDPRPAAKRPNAAKFAERLRRELGDEPGTAGG